MGFFSFTNISVALISLYVARRIYWEVTTGARRRAFIKQHGCLPAKPRRTRGPFLGLDLLLDQIKNIKEHRLLESWMQELRAANAHTISCSVLGNRVFITDDPENVKTLLATDFDVWSLGQERIKMMSAFLGHGIFTNEGAAWKHSREMLRPCFERSQVADVSLFEKHVNRLVDVLPKDGTTVDLQPLLQELTLDIATEFLFGQSTDALLDLEGKDMLRRGFVESFDYCTTPLENENKKWGTLATLFLPDRKFKVCAKKIQGVYCASKPLEPYSNDA
jgi:cytochrome P450